MPLLLDDQKAILMGAVICADCALEFDRLMAGVRKVAFGPTTAQSANVTGCAICGTGQDPDYVMWRFRA